MIRVIFMSFILPFYRSKYSVKSEVMEKKGRVAIGLSGGVDSVVAAYLLQKQGYEVVGVFLYCWPPKSEIDKDEMTRKEWMEKHGCRGDEDKKWALKNALKLGIVFEELDFSEEYNKKVVGYFYDEYKKGRTPNPDVLCNSEIKFGLFFEWAMKNGFDYVATGHYAGVENKDSFFKLMRGKDEHKDQTYFLWKLGQKELSKVLFPLREYDKGEVRKMAEEQDLPAAKRKDSQGICFVGDVKARDFLKRRLKEKRGLVVDVKGRVVGEHEGIWFYTIGQRGGWKLGRRAQKRFADKGKTPILYVIEKRASRNELVVGVVEEAMREKMRVRELSWIKGKIDKGELGGVKMRIRHTGELIECEIEEKRGELLVEMKKGQKGVAAGQSAVFYKGKECLGGGVIE